jgi:hypothetical protein
MRQVDNSIFSTLDLGDQTAATKKKLKENKCFGSGLDPISIRSVDPALDSEYRFGIRI